MSWSQHVFLYIYFVQSQFHGVSSKSYWTIKQLPENSAEWGISPKHVFTPGAFNKLTDYRYYLVRIPRHCESVGLRCSEACHFSQPLHLSGEVWFHYLGHEVIVSTLSGFSVCSNR